MMTIENWQHSKDHRICYIRSCSFCLYPRILCAYHRNYTLLINFILDVCSNAANTTIFLKCKTILRVGDFSIYLFVHYKSRVLYVHCTYMHGFIFDAKKDFSSFFVQCDHNGSRDTCCGFDNKTNISMLYASVHKTDYCDMFSSHSRL